MQAISIFDSITNTKIATVLMTLGHKLIGGEQGCFVTYDKANPEKSGGQVHFQFQSDLNNTVKKDVRTYNDGKAYAELENFIDGLRSKLPPETIDELEDKIRDTLIVMGRRFLDDYQVNVRYVKEKVKKFTITGELPTKAGSLDFKVRQKK